MKLFTAFIFSLSVVCSSAAQSARVPAELVGKWFEGSTSILGEQNMTTGAVTSRYGSSIGYTIEADGTFRYAALMKSTMYGCTTSLWNDRRGRISISGDTITFTPTKDYWFNSNSCYPSTNKESNKRLEEKTFNFEVGEKNGRKWLCMREVGKTRQEDILCFPRSDD